MVNNAGCRVLIIGQTYDSIKESSWSTLKYIIPMEYILKINEQQREITIKNGSRISLKGSDRVDTLRGISPSPDYIILDEADYHKPDNFDLVYRPMILDKNAQVVFVSTPKMVNGLLHTSYLKGINPNEGEWRSWMLPAWDARPDLREELMEIRKNTDPIIYDREYNASFTNAINNVFYNFELDTHVETKPELSKDDHILIATDFNVDLNASAICAERISAETGAKELHIIDEIQGVPYTETLCEKIAEKYPWHFENRRITIYPDPSGSSRVSQSKNTNHDIMRQWGPDNKGFNVDVKPPGHVGQKESANAVNAMLRNTDGEVRMYVHPRCNGVIASLQSTQWKENKRGKFEIDKAHNLEHFSDGIRYLVDYRYPIKKLAKARRSPNTLF